MRSRFPAELAATVCVALAGPVAVADAAPGDLDPSFGHGGTVSAQFNDNLATQSDGSVITSAYSDFAFTRLTPAGTTDTGFAGGVLGPVDVPGSFERVAALTIGPQDEVIAAGSVEAGGNNTDAAFVRLLSSGAVDSSFGSGGVATVDLGNNEQVIDAAALADGGVFAVGFTQVGTGGDIRSFALRLTPEGDLDTGFSGDGFAIDLDGDGAAADRSTAVEVLGDGRALIEISTISSDPSREVELARLLPDGTPDSSFSGDGSAPLPATGGIYGGELELDGLGGAYFVGTRYSSNDATGVVVRVDDAGDLDSEFSDDGVLHIDPPRSSGATIDLAGRLVYASSVSDPRPFHDVDLTLRRLTRSGDPDPSFSGDGLVTTDIKAMGQADYPAAITMDPSGRIVVGASSGLGGRYVLRYLSDDGPADADADRVLDGEDTCPERFGTAAHGGCPLHQYGVITIRYARRVDDFQGALDYGRVVPCAEAAKVVLFRKRPGRDKRIGRSSPPALPDFGNQYEPPTFRTWGVSALPRPGRYYALLGETLLPDIGVCEGNRSPTLKIKRRSRRS